MHKGIFSIQMFIVILAALISLGAVTINNFTQQKETAQDVTELPFALLKQYQEGNTLLSSTTLTAQLASCTAIKDYLTQLSTCILSTTEGPCGTTEKAIEQELTPLFIKHFTTLRATLNTPTTQDYTYIYNLKENTWTGEAYTPISIPGPAAYTLLPSYTLPLPQNFHQLITLFSMLDKEQLCILTHTPLQTVAGKKDLQEACNLPVPEGLTLTKKDGLITLEGTLHIPECPENLLPLNLRHTLSSISTP